MLARSAMLCSCRELALQAALRVTLSVIAAGAYRRGSAQARLNVRDAGTCSNLRLDRHASVRSEICAIWLARIFPQRVRFEADKIVRNENLQDSTFCFREAQL
jgi:hypothetical protein